MGKPAYPLPTRIEHLTGVYGECCGKSVAAKILGVSVSTISHMTSDGRLRTVCEGKKIDMHSISEYMDAPAQADFQARIAKRNGGKPPRFYAV